MNIKRIDDYFRKRPKLVMLNVRIPEELREALKELSESKGKSVNELVTATLYMLLDMEKGKKAS